MMNSATILNEDPAGQSAHEGSGLHSRWVEALRLVARHYRLPHSPESARLAAAANSGADDGAVIRIIARQLGLEARRLGPRDIKPTSWHLPFILHLADDRLVVVEAISSDGQAAFTLADGSAQMAEQPLDELLGAARELVLARPAVSVRDARVDAYIRPFEEDWLRRILLRDVGTYGHVLIASVIANLLGLSGILFSMQVYDRVVPAQSFNTLYVLFGGVILAIAFDFLMRRARMGMLDLMGKRADLEISDVVFGHALRIRNRARPASTGAFIAQLRDIDQLRELLTSTTVAALVDLPFFFLFLILFWWLAGALVLIPLAGLVALVLPGLMLQRRLRIHANEAMREASLRNALLVEAVQGIEDIKSLQAEHRFEQQWNHFNAVTGEAQIRLRSITNGLAIWTQHVQLGVYAVTIFAGAPLVISGDMTTGALVGASILGSRMLAPMGQLSSLTGRIQHARIAKRGLDRLMQMPVDHPEDESRIPSPAIRGAYELREARFHYGSASTPPVLHIAGLTISSGERIAVLGRNGAGKSTLLLALSGLLDPAEGEVLLDGLALQHIDPADLRRDLGLLTQNSRLFHGSLRDNITMGAPHATDEDIARVLAMVGADGFVRACPEGLDYGILEGGAGLSGGQRQAILLARLMIREPSVVLLDEPTSAMDEATERHFLQEFARWSAGRTVIIATHRMRVLELVDRLIVMDGGRIALDDAKDRALQALLGVSRVEGTRT
jgi:ATP-binding cassette subfamily C protein LapB